MNEILNVSDDTRVSPLAPSSLAFYFSATFSVVLIDEESGVEVAHADAGHEISESSAAARRLSTRLGSAS